MRRGNSFTVHNLVSDGGVPADRTDPNLVNGWGLARSATSPWWVADNGTDVSTLYQGNGTPVPLVVRVPGGPTGAVFNGTSSFVLRGVGPARFLRDRSRNDSRLESVGRSDRGRGCRNTRDNLQRSRDWLHCRRSSPYATDFHNGRVDVFNSTFKLLNNPGAFVDPNLPEG